jgi:hypothetical protein
LHLFSLPPPSLQLSLYLLKGKVLYGMIYNYLPLILSFCRNSGNADVANQNGEHSGSANKENVNAPAGNVKNNKSTNSGTGKNSGSPKDNKGGPIPGKNKTQIKRQADKIYAYAEDIKRQRNEESKGSAPASEE